MPRQPQSELFDLGEVYRALRNEMLDASRTGGLLKHSVSIGNAGEAQWRTILERFLPSRFRVGNGFVVDSQGGRSRQLDVIVYDAVGTIPMFPHPAGIHVPVESVYAVIETKTCLRRSSLEDACRQAASVYALRSLSRQKPMAGVLAATSVWGNADFNARIAEALADSEGILDLGCILAQGSFEAASRGMRFSSAEESLAFFMVRLLQRLTAMPSAPPVDLDRYCWNIGSLR